MVLNKEDIIAGVPSQLHISLPDRQAPCPSTNQTPFPKSRSRYRARADPSHYQKPRGVARAFNYTTSWISTTPITNPQYHHEDHSKK